MLGIVVGVGRAFRQKKENKKMNTNDILIKAFMVCPECKGSPPYGQQGCLECFSLGGVETEITIDNLRVLLGLKK